ncbi:PocR ligand-binding domain-containing protein [Vagococcus zengguangii]|uniref:PocR ligand-binding domain-containing protein n=1 Tax=Vagococcus zengguangii TaxID=2571750 RepID=UPI0011098AF0|nr:PocR ligand-binding domain-containing protein [Vagococcus zengguangii]TLG81430.1 helix-turn-helix domain-containing protein [Vagococcus zengguangii]
MAYKIEEVLDLKKWETLQESIAIATNLAIILVDYQGLPISTHSQVQPFCSLARKHPELKFFCEKCDARAAIEAVRMNEPFIYRCHFNIIDMAIPIMVDNQYTGAIMAGEITLRDNHDKLEQVLNLDHLESVQAFKREHVDLFEQYPSLTLDELTKFANMLKDLSHYIVNEAIKKEFLVKTYKQSLTIRKKDDRLVTSTNLDNLEYVEKELKQSLLDKRLNNLSTKRSLKNKQLLPAIDAIFYNKQENLDLTTLASLCNLSPSYLSRLIKEEFGEPFTKVYTKLKISWAKKLLKTTDLPINQISDELGYVEPSYFVRTFKKVTGMTPLKYRKNSN